MNKKQKIIVSITGIIIVILALLGLTYAYFVTNIEGNGNDKSIEVTTANLHLIYEDGNGTITANNIMPGTTLDPKTFTVTNDGNRETSYVAVLENVEYKKVSDNSVLNSFERQSDLRYTLTCKQYDDKGIETGTCDGAEDSTFPVSTSLSVMISNKIPVKFVHEYTLTINYIDPNEDQSADMGKGFSARVNIMDIRSVNPYATQTEDGPAANNTLAYNIIQNSITAKNGTTLVNTPMTKPVQEISVSWGTGKYEPIKMSGFPGWDGLTYGTTQEEADNGAYEVTGDTNLEKCNSVKGNYLSDVYNETYDGKSYGYVEDCSDKGTPIIRTEILDYEKELSVTSDDLGTSYYYRGMVNDNYINFAGMCFRIVRIEGDGSIEIILASKDELCSTTMKKTSGSTLTGSYNYGYINFTKADYLNGDSSSMKVGLDTFLATISSENQEKLKNKMWCLGNITDKYDETTGELLNNPLDSDSFYYSSGKRLLGLGGTSYATLKCDGETFSSKIGTLTADEIVLAGATLNLDNPYFYLINNTNLGWWSLSLSKNKSLTDYGFIVTPSGGIDYHIVSMVYYGFQIRPALTLLPETKISSGDGTLEHPYELK